MSVVASVLLVIGFLFVVSGVIGILRLPDFYTRLHAMGKCDTVGVTLMALGLAILVGPTLAGIKILLLILFVALANPPATHALGRAAYRAGLVPWSPEGPPETGSRKEESEARRATNA